MVVIIGWALLFTIPIFLIAKKFDILRISEELEKSGIDVSLHDQQAYPPESSLEPNLINSYLGSLPVPATETHSDDQHEHPPQPSITNIVGKIIGPQQNNPAQRRRPAPRLQNASLSSMNLIGQSNSSFAEEP